MSNGEGKGKEEARGEIERQKTRANHERRIPERRLRLSRLANCHTDKHTVRKEGNRATVAFYAS